jgi:poly-gamma-glutamate capsule biosynthesis protein CapA/YwtB (metallophosphatase superfamily)
MAQNPLSIVAVGDMLPTRRLFSGDTPSTPSFGEVLNLISRADIAFGNFEIPLSTRGRPLEKLINFRASPDIAEDVRKCGFHVLNLANNHIVDYGDEALLDTIHALEAQDVKHVGAGRDLAEAIAPVIINANGRRVGFLAFSCLLPTGTAASHDRAGLAPIHIHSAYEINIYWQMEEPGEPEMIRIHTWPDDEDREFAQDCIRRLRDEVDFLVTSVHWGYGSGENLAAYQRPLGHALIDAGADIVLGNHAHAVHPLEVYRGKVILYSPCTFIGQQGSQITSDVGLAIWATMSHDGYIARIEINPGGEYVVRLTPITLSDDGLPEIARPEAFERIADRISRLSEVLGTEVRVTADEVLVGALDDVND